MYSDKRNVPYVCNITSVDACRIANHAWNTTG